MSEERTFAECLDKMDPSVRDAIREACRRYNSAGLLIFQCEDLSSRLIGERFAIGYGPQNTIKDVPLDSRCAVAPPRGYAWQYRLEAYSIGVDA